MEQTIALENDTTLSLFEQLIGRSATEGEIIHLYRVKNALGLRDDDALWLILMTLEDYGLRFGGISEKLKADSADLAEIHKQRLDSLLVESVLKATESVASRLAQEVETSLAKISRNRQIASAGWVAVALILLCVCCFVGGYIGGSGHLPWWTRPADQLSMLQLLPSAILGAPAGWVFVLLAVPATVFYLCNMRLSMLPKKQRIQQVLKGALAVVGTAFLLYITI